MSRKTQGFSLIELMIVLAVLGILLAVVLPAYSQYKVIALRSAAKSVLLEVAARQDVYMGQLAAYQSDTADSGVVLGYAIPSDVFAAYKFTVEAQANVNGTAEPVLPGYEIKAEPRAGSSQVADGVLKINQFGLRTPVDKW